MGAAPSPPVTAPVLETGQGDSSRGLGLNRWLQIFLTIIAGTVVAIIAWTIIERFQHVIILLLASMLLGFLLGPLVDKLEKGGTPRLLSILLVYIAIIAALIVGAFLFLGPLINQLQGVLDNLPALLDERSQGPNTLDRFFREHGIPLQVSSLRDQLFAYLSSASTTLLGGTLAFVAGVVSIITDLLLVLAITFYLLLDGGAMRNHALRLLPERVRGRWFFIEAALTSVLGGYIRGQVIVAATVGVAAWLGSVILGVQYPLVIGLLAFLFEFIPLLGPVLGMVPAVIISAFQPFPLVVWVIIYFIVLQQVEANVIVPRISGHAVGLHPLAALLALVAGFEIGGLWGAFLGVPIAGVLYVIALALYSDATKQTQLLIPQQRKSPYSSLRQVVTLTRPRRKAVEQVKVLTPTTPAVRNERLATIAEEQAQLKAQFEADQSAEAGEQSAVVSAGTRLSPTDESAEPSASDSDAGLHAAKPPDG